MNDWLTYLRAILTKAVLLDDMISDVAARLLARDEVGYTILREWVLPRVRDAERAELVGELVLHAGGPESTRTLSGELKEQLKMRHRLAHSTPRFDDDPSRLVLDGISSGGKHESVTLYRTQLDRVDQHGWRLLSLLDEVAVQAGGETRIDFSQIRLG